MDKTIYIVVKRDKDGKFISCISGLGKNKGKWDCGHSRSAAYKHAKELNSKNDGYVYKVEESM